MSTPQFYAPLSNNPLTNHKMFTKDGHLLTNIRLTGNKFVQFVCHKSETRVFKHYEGDTTIIVNKGIEKSSRQQHSSKVESRSMPSDNFLPGNVLSGCHCRHKEWKSSNRDGLSKTLTDVLSYDGKKDACNIFTTSAMELCFGMAGPESLKIL